MEYIITTTSAREEANNFAVNVASCKGPGGTKDDVRGARSTDDGAPSHRLGESWWTGQKIPWPPSFRRDAFENSPARGYLCVTAEN
ncbi:unnamed protein product [Clonostachys solani]|uniref:Uncharacterized protein n=1 Tax=Clonostachys solani TaxID=160281 RepID=A0A9N9W2K4_9HYPO|nr:unnamed protein product [Clonostachys solani]